MIENLAAFYRVDTVPAERAWVIVSMIASIDGATAVDGVSGALGHPTDKAVLGLARAAADVILVGAATVRAEGYGPPRPPTQLVVVSRGLGGGLADLGALAAAPNTSMVTPSEGAEQVNLGALLARWPGQVAVCEGGPNLNGQLLAAGLVDEVFLTISPRMLAGASSRLAHGPDAADPTAWHLRHILHDDGYLFLRYRRRR